MYNCNPVPVCASLTCISTLSISQGMPRYSNLLLRCLLRRSEHGYTARTRISIYATAVICVMVGRPLCGCRFLMPCPSCIHRILVRHECGVNSHSCKYQHVRPDAGTAALRVISGAEDTSGNDAWSDGHGTIIWTVSHYFPTAGRAWRCPLAFGFRALHCLLPVTATTTMTPLAHRR